MVSIRLAPALLLALVATIGWAAGARAAPPPQAITAGHFYTCAIKSDGVPVCWGSTGAVPDEVGTVTQIDAGGSHTCAIRPDATPVCWGVNGAGQSTVPGDIGTVTQISPGVNHTCAVKTGGAPVCWGSDTYGQATIPASVDSVTQIAAGEEHTCAIETGGTPVCWGDDFYGQRTIPDGIGTVTQIDVGWFHTCAVKTDGTPVCWGNDNHDESTVPGDVGTVTQIAAGEMHTWAIESDGTPVCWGRTPPLAYPRSTLPTDIGTVTQIAAGGDHSCAIETDGTPVCWGSHIHEQLGGPHVISSPPPPSLVGGGPFEHAYVLDSLPGGRFPAPRFFISDGALPPGVTLDETTGVLSGTPSADGTYTGAVTATNDVFSPDATQPFSITVDTAAPAAPSGLTTSPASPSSDLKPRIVGTAEAGSTVRLYESATCTGSPRAVGSAGTFASPGLQIAVAAGSTTTVYATATDGAGNVSGCSTSKATYVNAEDPKDDPGTPTDPGGTGGGGQPQPQPKPQPDEPASPPACVVPKLAGKTLARAKRALRAANCRLGKVTRPKRPKGKRRRILVVKSTSPRHGARPADGKVDLRLRVKPKRPRR